MHLLAAIALAMAFFSGLARPLLGMADSLFLRIVILANTSYILLTGAVLYSFLDQLLWPAWLYFTGEIAVITFLIYREWRALVWLKAAKY